MLNILHQVENELKTLLLDKSMWKSMLVDYHPPTVERLWCEWGDYRIYLHRIYPCSPNEALFHPHPWASAMRILFGNYEMAIGFGVGEELPPIAARLILGAGSEYEMTHPDSWHYVRPIDQPTISLMVTSKPWSRSSPKSEKLLQPLTDLQQQELLAFFNSHYATK